MKQVPEDVFVAVLMNKVEDHHYQMKHQHWQKRKQHDVNGRGSPFSSLWF